MNFISRVWEPKSGGEKKIKMTGEEGRKRYLFSALGQVPYIAYGFILITVI